jgi:RNA polymerase sigma-70 factor (ECF subfamily)
MPFTEGLPPRVLARLARQIGLLHKDRVTPRAQQVAESGQSGTIRIRIDDERAVLRRMANGDERALEVLFVAHAQRMYRVAYQYLRSSWAARAVVQDVFTVLWTRRRSLVVRGPLKAYLTAAVRNRAQSVLREETRRRERDARWAESNGQARRDIAMASASAEGADFATGIARVDSRLRDGVDVQAIVHQALAGLPERQRTVFRLRVEHHMSTVEVQGAIGAVSAKAVEQLFARAVRTLRARLLADDNPRTVRAVDRPATGARSETTDSSVAR